MAVISRPARSIFHAALAAFGLAATSLVATTAMASEVYIQQARGTVAPGTSVLTKPAPEATTQTSQPAPTPTAPDTCNAQNASSSQACYTATQQARPASK